VWQQLFVFGVLLLRPFDQQSVLSLKCKETAACMLRASLL
jgi:hypothetical protein